jgi:hypothetical protein
MKNIEILKSYLSGDRPYVKVGYTKLEEKRKVGDTWTDDDGFIWEQKNGYKVKRSRMAAEVKNAIGKKICSVTGRDIEWGDRLDKIAFEKSGKSFDALIEEETILRAKGLYKYYEELKIQKNYLSYLNDIISKLQESLDFLKTEDKLQFVNSTGMVEEWKMKNKQEIEDTIKKDLKYAQEQVIECTEKITELENKLK